MEKTIRDFFYNKNPLLALSYISLNKKDIYGAKISKDLGINQGGVSVTLKRYQDLGLLESKEIGRTLTYNINSNDPLFKAFRVFENILELKPLIYHLQNLAYKVILFGSCATGDDSINSDIDLYIKSDEENTEEISRIILKYRRQHLTRELNPIIVSPYEEMEMQKSDPIFLEEVKKGILLWEGSYYE